MLHKCEGTLCVGGLCMRESIERYRDFSDSQFVMMMLHPLLATTVDRTRMSKYGGHCERTSEDCVALSPCCFSGASCVL